MIKKVKVFRKYNIQTGAIYAESGKQKRWPLENRSYQQGN
jgi:hypothetical protein